MSGSRDAQAWKKLIAEQDRTGLSAREFASRHKLNPNTLAWWRSELRRRERESASVPAFVPVVVSYPADSPSTMAPTLVEVVLRNGLRIRFEHAVDKGGLRLLAEALESLS